MRTWSTMHKAGWGAGPWQTEPDKASWTDPATGLPCLIVRNRSGALCGYVGVRPGHPWHGVGYSEHAGPEPDCGESWCGHAPQDRVDVHGGLTYAAPCQEDADEASGICHVPEPGQPDDVWWFGFDCNHCFDLAPEMEMQFRNIGHDRHRLDQTYRTVDYVRAEVITLAAQLALVAEEVRS